MKTIIILILITVSTYARIPDYLSPEVRPIETKYVDKSHVCYEKKHGSIIQTFTPEYPNRPYDVLHYNLFMDITTPLSSDIVNIDRSFDGVNEIKLVITEDGTSKIELDNHRLNIYRVKYLHQELEFANHNSLLIIQLPQKFNTGAELTFTIDYSFKGDQNKGAHFYPKGLFAGERAYNDDGKAVKDSMFVEENVFYTMSEPQKARMWMPCNDNPDDKATSNIYIKVPPGYTALSNGLLKDVVSFGDFDIFLWENKYPITTYLMVVTASKFYKWADWYERITEPGEMVELSYYVWEGDQSSEKPVTHDFNGEHLFMNMVHMMKFFSTNFGEYPFDKYGQVAVLPFDYGGMEHQTMTTIHRRWLAAWDDIGVAHELAHQWIGDMVTCATWADIWINEGGASWSEALWAGEIWGEEWYDQVLYGKRRGFMSDAWQELPVYDIPIEILFNWSTTYAKASWVYHMLAEIVGQEKFMPLFRQFLADNAHTSVATEDFVTYFEESIKNPPMEIRLYFEQWLSEVGFPAYDIYVESVENPDGKFDISIDVDQYQQDEFENWPEVFVMPLPIVFEGPEGQSEIRTFYNDSRNQHFETVLDFAPVSVTADTTAILCYSRSNLTVSSIEDSWAGGSISVSPIPAIAGKEIIYRYSNPEYGFTSITLIDQLGNKRRTLLESYIHAGNFEININTQELESGVYFVHLRNVNVNHVEKIVIAK